jgi:chromosomal replication initiator protein
MTNNGNLNNEYTFENLVVGSSNQFAYAASKAVATRPGSLYNPLIIYGHVGLGKTHLLHAIGHTALYENLNVTYETFETFFIHLRRHITNNTMEHFRDKYRYCDLLLLDDIQFIANKPILQEEFFNTFNVIKQFGNQIVVTSDRHPKDLIVDDRIKNRLEGGLIVEVLAPDVTTKQEIIRKKCKRNRTFLDEDMVSYLASHVVDNVRIIEGVLLKIHAYSVLMEEGISLDLVKHVVDETKLETEEMISIEKIIAEVASYCNVKPSEMRSRLRSRTVVKARRIVFYLSRELTNISMSALASEFGMKDHASVSHAIKATKKLIDDDNDFRADVESIHTQIQSKGCEL